MKTARLLTVSTVALCLSLAFSQETITFTNCGQGGAYGPSQGRCDSEYAGSNFKSQVTVNDVIQEWVVPHTGDYTIEVWGAGGSESGDTTCEPCSWN